MIRVTGMKYAKCPKCNGSGEVIDQRSLGAELRELRERKRLSLRSVAEVMHISAPYLSDMEKGNRAWSPERIEQFKTACK